MGDAEGEIALGHCFCCPSQGATKQNCCPQLIQSLGQLGGNAPNQFPYSLTLSHFILLLRLTLHQHRKQTHTLQLWDLRTQTLAHYVHVCAPVCARTHTHKHTNTHAHNPHQFIFTFWIPTWLLRGLLEPCAIHLSLWFKVGEKEQPTGAVGCGFRAWLDIWELFSLLPTVCLTHYLLFK